MGLTVQRRPIQQPLWNQGTVAAASVRKASHVSILLRHSRGFYFLTSPDSHKLCRICESRKVATGGFADQMLVAGVRHRSGADWVCARSSAGGLVEGTRKGYERKE